MPASMMIAVTGSMPKVSGSRIADVAAGPSPGRTPISMPMTTPIRQYRRFAGSSTTPKPSRTGDRSTCLLQQVRDRHRERGHEQEGEPGHHTDTGQDRHAPALPAEETQPHEAEQGGGDLEADHLDHRDRKSVV